MVIVYVLINPLNNEPFYVGSTNNLKVRLSAHKRGHEGTKEKKELIRQLYKAGKEPSTLLLFKCSEKAAAKAEAHVFNLLTCEGYDLLNDPVRITYSRAYKYRSTQKTTKYPLSKPTPRNY